MRLATTAWPASGDRVFPSDSYFGQVTILPVMPACVGSVVACAEPGHASSPVAGSVVPTKLFDNGWLHMSWGSWPGTAPSEPEVAHRMVSNPPRPGSLADRTSIPPPASCSPLSGKSSSNTINESLPVGSGVGTTSTVTGAKAVVLVEVHPATKTLQAGGT